jgi:hypothetical protein
MANIYRSDQNIADLNLVVRAAATILLSHPNEVAGLQALCLSVGQTQDKPTDNIFELLMREGDRIDLDGARQRGRRLSL